MTSRASITPPPQRLPPLSSNRSLHKALKAPAPRADISPFLRAEGPYLTFDMLKKQEEKEGKRRWITRRGFSTAVKCRPRYIPNYVQATVSANPATHQFRECNRGRWLAGDFKPAKYKSLHRANYSNMEIKLDLSFH